MDITLSAIVLGIFPLSRKWLVYQVRNGPLATEVVYAEAFVHRCSVVRDAPEAEDRTDFLSDPLPPEVMRLPVDKR
jgi:hypothetical protein